MKEQNFTQYATANGYPSDYDILDHGDLSPSGYVSKRSRKGMQDRQAERARQNLTAHNEYTEAILTDTIVDPSGEITKEKILAYRQKMIDSRVASKVSGLEHNIEFIGSLGRMSHKLNGKLKLPYQRAVDGYKEELAKYK